MARPVNHDVTQVAIKTNSGSPTNLGVFQSLDVRAAAPKSAQLAEGLASVLGVAQPLMNEHIKKRSEEQTNEGIADAAFGKIDNEKLAKGIAYQVGVEHIQTKQLQFDSQQAWQTHYAENVDKTLPAAEVAKQYDSFMKAALGDIATSNPKLAAKLAPGFMKGLQETIVGHQAQLTRQHIDMAASVMQTEVVAAQQRGEPLEFFPLVEDYIKLTGDKTAGYTLGIKAVAEQAIAAGDPDILRAIPVAVTNDDGTTTLNPDFTAEHRQFITQATEAATAEELRGQKIARGFAKAQLENGWMAGIASGNPPTDAEIMAQWEEGGLYSDIDELIGWLGKSRNAREATSDTLMFGGFDNSKPYYMQIGMLDPAGKEITKERVQGQTNREVEAQLMVEKQNDPKASPEVLMARAAARITATQAFPYEPLKSVFTYAPMTDPQVFDNAASAFAALPVSQRAAYVPDEKRRAELETYLNRRDTKGVGNANQAIDELVTVDPDLAAKNITMNRTALGDARDKIPALVLKDGFWNDIEVAELFDAPYAQRIIDASTEIRVGRGQSVGEAQAGALADFTATHMIIESGGAKRSIKRVPGVTEKVGEAISWVEGHLEGIGKIKGVEIPPGSRLQRDFMSRDDTTFVVVGSDGQFISPRKLRFPAAQLERTYREKHPQGSWRDREANSAAEQKRRQAIEDFDRNNTNPSMFNTRD